MLVNIVRAATPTLPIFSMQPGNHLYSAGFRSGHLVRKYIRIADDVEGKGRLTLHCNKA
jgi:hypothetical protein